MSMAYGLTQTLEIVPGRHVLQIEFVATDHGPFSPPLLVEVPFTVER
jgi:hypothetical protein